MTDNEIIKQRYKNLLEMDNTYRPKGSCLDSFEYICKYEDGFNYVLAYFYYTEREIRVSKAIATEQDYKNIRKAFPNYIIGNINYMENKPYVDLSGQPMDLARRQRDIPL